MLYSRSTLVTRLELGAKGLFRAKSSRPAIVKRAYTNKSIQAVSEVQGECAMRASAMQKDYRSIAQDLVDFINRGVTPYHVVEECSRRLQASGFQHLSEKNAWKIEPGGKYYFTRNSSTICAFAVGQKYAPGNGFYMVGAHTDSPCIKLKPVTKSVKSGFLMLNVETYGGGLWHTWFDRDLGLAGRVLLRDTTGSSPSASAPFRQALVNITAPILRIPMLAIHLQRDINTAGFKPNWQTNLAPMLATAAKAQLGALAAPPAPAFAGSTPTPQKESDKHHIVLMELLAKELGVQIDDILDFELNVCDVQPSTIGGLKEEFIFSGRLDNLCMSYTGLQALIDSCCASDALANEGGVRAVALFDHEEVGSDSAQGAGGPVMRDTITRVAKVLSKDEEGAVERALRSSFLVSADMAHALHPLYTDKHDPDMAPRFNDGLVLKHNVNQRYATNAVSAALFREIGRLHGLPCQEFAVRNDMPCGSTIGPILASSLGCRTVDVGVPQLAMHSIREMCGCDDVGIAYRHLLAFYEDFHNLDASLDVDALPPADIKGTIQDTECRHTQRKLISLDTDPR